MPASRRRPCGQGARLLAAARLGVAVALLGAVAACGTAQETLRDNLDVTAPGQFRYVVTATMLHPAESRQAEHARMLGLAKRLEERGLCPQGYEIVSRDLPQPIVRDSRFEYTVQDITYVGRCKT
jgi:hypothetical protein